MENTSGFTKAVQQKNRVSLYIGEKIYSGWTEVKIEFGLNIIARVCQITASSSPEDEMYDGIPNGVSCRVKIGDDTVITGYVTKKEKLYGKEGTTISIDIKSRTIDLEECSVPPNAQHSFRKVKLASVIESLAGNYGILVVDQVGSKEIIDQEIQNNETIKSVLEKLLKNRSLLLLDDSYGKLLLTFAGSAGLSADSLQYGKNIITGKRTQDLSKIFRYYVVRGQGTDSKSQRKTPGNQLQKIAENDWCFRNRYFVTVMTGNATEPELEKRVNLLKNNSIGSADTFTYSVQGWRQSNGELWRANTFVKIKDESLNTNETLLISKVTFSLSETGGSTTTLEIRHPASFISTGLPDTASSTAKKTVKDDQSKNSLVILAGKDTGKR